MVLEYGFSSAVPALKYVFHWLSSFSKAELMFSLCSVANFVLIIPPIEFCKRQSIFNNRKEIKEKYRTFLAALQYALPFSLFYPKNYENRIGGASRCFDSFSNSLGESSRVILTDSPIYIISPIFFSPLTRRKCH